jgi:glycosyltransferase involved in cell wall biosynthesis
LVISSASSRTDIAGAKTIHLLSGNFVSSSDDAQQQKIGVKAHLKSVIPVSLKMLVIEIVRAVRLLSKRRFCAEQIDCFDPNVVYCFRTFAEGVLASFCHSHPLLLRTAGPDISKLPKFPVFRQLVRRALKTADVVVTESIWERELVQKLCRFRVSPEVEILGVDTHLFQPPVSQGVLRQRYDVSKDAFVIVSNRSLEGHYNGWLLVEAVESVAELCPNLFLLYASPTKMGLRTKARAEAITARCSHIRFLDRRVPHAEVPDILGCADVFVSLSSYDGIPNSVLEAMACGIVPIVAELPQLHEWIEHGKTGYFVQQRDVNGLASLIRDLYNNRERLPTIASRCVEQIRKRGSYDDCMERTRELLLKLAKPTDFKKDAPAVSPSLKTQSPICCRTISE